MIINLSVFFLKKYMYNYKMYFEQTLLPLTNVLRNNSQMINLVLIVLLTAMLFPVDQYFPSDPFKTIETHLSELLANPLVMSLFTIFLYCVYLSNNSVMLILVLFMIHRLVLHKGSGGVPSAPPSVLPPTPKIAPPPKPKAPPPRPKPKATPPPPKPKPALPPTPKVAPPPKPKAAPPPKPKAAPPPKPKAAPPPPKPKALPPTPKMPSGPPEEDGMM
jgi:hypothetical protein